MLRWLISVFLLLNLGLFAWGYLQSQPSEEIIAPLPAGLPTIELLSERKQPQQLAETPAHKETEPNAEGAVPETDLLQETSQPDTPKQPQTRCLRLGPFNHQADAAAAAELLNDAGHVTQIQAKIERQQSGYWVLIPPGDEDADFVIVNLELAGIQDLWRFDKGELAGSISLGLYSDRKQAQTRRMELQERGFNAEIRPRQVEKPGYWIESNFSPGDEAAEDALEKLYVEHHWLGYPPPVCEDAVTP